jgi:hypothetical protein
MTTKTTDYAAVRVSYDSPRELKQPGLGSMNGHRCSTLSAARGRSSKPPHGRW